MGMLGVATTRFWIIDRLNHGQWVPYSGDFDRAKASRALFALRRQYPNQRFCLVRYDARTREMT